MREARARLAYLVADDSAPVAQHVADLLDEAGVEVVGPAADGREALQLFRQARPDGAVLDFEMPHANGLEVLTAIRTEQGSRPCLVIMLTSHTDESLRTACLEAGADHFLHKPSDSARLQDIVAAHVASANLPRQQSDDGESEI